MDIAFMQKSLSTPCKVWGQCENPVTDRAHVADAATGNLSHPFFAHTHSYSAVDLPISSKNVVLPNESVFVKCNAMKGVVTLCIIHLNIIPFEDSR